MSTKKDSNGKKYISIPISLVPSYAWEKIPYITAPDGTTKDWRSVLDSNPNYLIYVDPETYEPYTAKLKLDTSSQDVLEKLVSSSLTSAKGVDIYLGLNYNPEFNKLFYGHSDFDALFGDWRVKNVRRAWLRNPKLMQALHEGNNLAGGIAAGMIAFPTVVSAAVESGIGNAVSNLLSKGKSFVSNAGKHLFTSAGRTTTKTFLRDKAAPSIAKYVVAPEAASRTVDELQRLVTGTTLTELISNYLLSKGWNPFLANLVGSATNPGYWINFGGAGKYTSLIFNKVGLGLPNLSNPIKLSPVIEASVNALVPKSMLQTKVVDPILFNIDPRNLNNVVGLYARYYFRPKQFKEASLPTVYRKFKYTSANSNEMPSIKGRNILLSNPNSRFLDANNRAIDWTNVTTDVPVRSHESSWDSGFTIALPGRSLLSKKLISTHPSDTFFSSKLNPRKKNVTVISGDPYILNWANNHGLRFINNEDLNSAYRLAVDPTNLDAKLDFSNAAKIERLVARSNFGSPTKLDYDFVDYIFRPKFRSEVNTKFYPTNKTSLTETPSWYGPLFSSPRRREYLIDKSEWGNVMYDPFTPIEGLYRDTKNITILPIIKSSIEEPKFDMVSIRSIYDKFNNKDFNSSSLSRKR